MSRLDLLDRSQLLRESLLNKQQPRPLTLGPPHDFGPCNCVGPKNGQPLCPCQMRGVQIKDGRYIRIQDLGPAP